MRALFDSFSGICQLRFHDFVANSVRIKNYQTMELLVPKFLTGGSSVLPLSNLFSKFQNNLTAKLWSTF